METRLIEIEKTEVHRYPEAVRKGGILKRRFWAQRIARHIIRRIQSDLFAEGISMVQVTEMPDCGEFRVKLSVECMVIPRKTKQGPRKLFTPDEIRAIRAHDWGPADVKIYLGKSAPQGVLTGIKRGTFYPEVGLEE